MSVDRPRSSKDEGWLGWLPGIATLQRYEARWLPRDIAAGLVLTTALAPVGIAYAVASGLPGACGLYATISPCSPTLSSAPAASWCSGPTPRWRRSFWASWPRSPPETQIARSRLPE